MALSGSFAVVILSFYFFFFFFFKQKTAYEIVDYLSRGLGDVYKRQREYFAIIFGSIQKYLKNHTIQP